MRLHHIGIVWILSAVYAFSGSWLGDHGHYLRFDQSIWLLNPEGRDFTLTVVRDVAVPPYLGEIGIKITAPAGETILEETVPKGQGEHTLQVAATGQGVYHLQTRAGGTYYFVRSDLSRMVLHCGDPKAEDAVASSWFHLINMLPRRWWFFVPEGTTEFSFGIRHRSGTSGREDMAVVFYSPRGQRVRAWRGSPGLERPVGGEISVGIPVEPTMDGRFWSVVISNGDSHWHSDNELVLRGIPPYIAQSPEQWFDPAVGEPAAVALPHHDRDLKPDRFAHHMPNTWLGDQSYSGFVGPARIRIKNSQLGPLTFGLGMYTLSTDDWRAGIAVRDSDGTVLDRLTVHQPAEEWNVNEHRLQLKSPPKGVFTVEANGNHHFLWTDPALPMVVMPDEGSNSLTFEFSGPRHWYFQVPAKTDKFTVTVHCPRERDKAVVEVHAPDRLMRIADAVEGTATALVIEVPENLRGQRWFLRIYPSSGTDYAGPDTAKYHRPTVTAKITIDGVPFRLSPTWGQWFDEQAQ